MKTSIEDYALPDDHATPTYGIFVIVLSYSYNKKFLRNFVKLEERLRVFVRSRVEVAINVQNDWIVLYFCNRVTTLIVDSSNDEFLISYIWTAEWRYRSKEDLAL